MTFHHFVRKKRSRAKQCSDCGHRFELGEIYYSRRQEHKAHNRTVGHFCEECYNKKFIQVKR